MTRDQIIEAMARAICGKVSPCAYDLECKRLGLSCAEERIREATAAYDAIHGPVMPETPSDAIRQLLRDCADPSGCIYTAIRNLLIAEQKDRDQ